MKRHTTFTISLDAVIIGAAFILSLPACNNAHTERNPIAACRVVDDGETDLSCISLRLAPAQFEHRGTTGEVRATVQVDNRCRSAMAVLAAPIDTRLLATDTWENSVTSAYGRFMVYETRRTGDSRGQFGLTVQSLPAFVVVPARSLRTYPLGGGTPRLADLRPGETRHLQLCTFAAPASSFVTPTAGRFGTDRSIENHNRAAQEPCPVILRRSSGLICSAPVRFRL